MRIGDTPHVDLRCILVNCDGYWAACQTIARRVDRLGCDIGCRREFQCDSPRATTICCSSGNEICARVDFYDSSNFRRPSDCLRRVIGSYGRSRNSDRRSRIHGQRLWRGSTLVSGCIGCSHGDWIGTSRRRVTCPS